MNASSGEADGGGAGSCIVDGMRGICPAMWTVQGCSGEGEVDMACE
jgi:hypothetical protein